MLQTNIPGTIIKFIANYIKGRKAYTTYRNHTSKQHQFKTGVPQGGILSPTLFNIYTSDIPPPSAPVQVMAYADDITITSTHTSTSAAKKYIQPYLHKVFAWTKQNNLLLNPDKTTCTSSSVWSPIASSTSINKLQVMQNAALRTATGCTQDRNIQHLHDETLTLPIHGTYSSTPHNTNRKHNIHHIPYTNTQHTSTLQG